MKLLIHLIIMWSLFTTHCCLDNGLALTPPMGWMSWQRFRCNTDCKNDPDNCIREELFKKMADLMVSDGYKDAGYEYIVIDDCWSERERDSEGNLQADVKRFPNGIKALSKYVHSKGLKLGLYGDIGRSTCEKYPGNELYLHRDANIFAKWEIDFLKVDGCYADINDYNASYPLFGNWLNKTGRPILYSCSWPFFVTMNNKTPNYKRVAELCNIWRSYYDVEDSWESIQSIIQFHGNITDVVKDVVGPGHFNDPDMLVIGNFGLSYDQEQVQMALWAIMAAPLIMSNDLRHIRKESRSILQNNMAIAVNQDPLGKQGQRIYKSGKIEIWKKQLTDNKVAVAVVNYGDGGAPAMFHTTLENIGLKNEEGYRINDVFNNKPVKNYGLRDKILFRPNPSGVEFIVASPVHYKEKKKTTSATSDASMMKFPRKTSVLIITVLSVIFLM